MHSVPLEALPCLACDQPISTLGTRIRLASVHLVECPACGSLNYFPRPDSSEQRVLHDSADYYQHPYFTKRRGITPELRARCRETFQRIGKAIALSYLAGERILDVGCDDGSFVLCAAEVYGATPLGLDVSRRAVEEARQAGIEAHYGPIASAPPEWKNLQLITAIDVIEHVASPADFLKECRARLRPGGIVYLETPNIRSFVYGLGKVIFQCNKGWLVPLFKRLFPPEHLIYFTPSAFDRMARGCGFDVPYLGTRVLPMRDLATSPTIGFAIRTLETLDSLFKREILICSLLRKPTDSQT